MTTADQPSIGRYDNGEHLLAARVYYEDTDFTGFVYHANYLRFFERGRSEMLRVMGPAEDMDGYGAFAITRVEIDFKQAAKIHDELLIRTAFHGAKGARMTFIQKIERAGVLLAQAKVVAVPISETGRVRRPTDGELALWARHQKADPPAQ
jgi:acyl-CoA thioester hydrolase